MNASHGASFLLSPTLGLLSSPPKPCSLEPLKRDDVAWRSKKSRNASLKVSLQQPLSLHFMTIPPQAYSRSPNHVKEPAVPIADTALPDGSVLLTPCTGTTCAGRLLTSLREHSPDCHMHVPDCTPRKQVAVQLSFTNTYPLR